MAVKFICTECDTIHDTFDAAAACHHGIGGVEEVKSIDRLPPLSIGGPNRYRRDWSVVGDLREIVDFDHESTNYIVRGLLVREGWSPTGLDPEYSCFYGYVANEAEAKRLFDAMMRIVKELARLYPERVR